MSEIVLSKTQSEDKNFISVRRSMVIKGGKNNVLAVQMHNNADFIINGVSMRVEYFDRAGGAVHEEKELTVGGLMGLPGTDFILPDIAILTSREAANVKIYAVTSGDYYYRLTNDGQGAESKVKAGLQTSKGGTGGGKAVYNTKKRFTAIYALFIAALFALSLAIGFSDFINGGDSSAANNTEIVRENGDQNVETRQTY